MSPRPLTPAEQLLGQLQAELQQHPPFAQMEAAHVRQFLAQAEQAYYAPGELLLAPEQGPVERLFYIRRGAVSARRGIAEATGGLHYEAGECFPIGALLGARAVTAQYQAQGDVFCLLVPAAQVQTLARSSAPFADFLNQRVAQFLALSRRALQVSYASQTLAEQSLETPLGELLAQRAAPVGVPPDTPLRQALTLMHERRIGSVLVLDAQQAPLGILTRHDVLDRVTLPELPLDTPIETVMSQPLRALRLEDRAQDAALLMSRHGIRHVPVLDQGRVVGLVSERDLFALQRLSLKQVSSAIRAARDVATLRIVAQDIRRFARSLMAQGVAARQLTELISHLNDVLAERLVQILAQAQGLDLQRFAWLAFGSEGRGEQTIATDQDNGIVFDGPPSERARWLALGQAVNAALDECGYPLCKGGIMAGREACCLSQQEWLEAFSDWIEHGAPEDLLKASIFFDLRPIAGHAELARPLQALLQGHAARQPRFMRQLAENALRNRAPLNWLGALDTGEDGQLDLKLQGTAIFVDVARLFALAHGLAATGTRARFEAAAPLLQSSATESEAWSSAFEFLQLLRLRRQMEAAGESGENPNRLDPARLNDIDRRMLKESLRVARRLQQRLELDWLR
ncbi:MAG: DUF294 nucleotidyltransferase-like domain-containing protein [Roseateles sp.]